MTKRRKFTESERQEVYDLCYRSKLGTPDHTGRCMELFKINEKEYGEIASRAADDAVKAYQSSLK